MNIPIDSSLSRNTQTSKLEYYELFVQSNFSFLVGASHPEELVNEAIKKGYSGIAITDECSFAGVVKAYAVSKEHSIKLIVGSYFKIDCISEKDLHVILLCPSKAAYTEVSSLITLARRRCKKGEYQLSWRDADNLEHAFAIWLPTDNSKVNRNQLTKLTKGFTGRLWVGVSRLLTADDYKSFAIATELSKSFNIPIVAHNHVLMHKASRLPLQHCLTAIQHNQSIDSLGTHLLSNAEQHLREVDYLESLYPKALLQETVSIANQCHFELSELKYNYPDEVIPGDSRPIEYLRQLCYRGVKQRWPSGASKETLATLEKELAMIEEMRYEHYFLTVYDIVAYAKEQNILCQGRGSAANSVVCYCLMITEVDPEQNQLLFERFISKERNEPPDIDVDFEHQRREEVIQYIFKKFTRERAALAATVITYRMKSAIRDVGKALGLDQSIIDYLAKSLAWWDKPNKLNDYFQSTRLNNKGLLAQQYYDLVMTILGFPRHLSQHVGGFVITNEPVSTLVPVENASMPNRTVIQWDKYDIETLGLLKVDVLALGMLTMLHKCMQLTQIYSDIRVLQDIPKEDPATYNMLCRGDSVGVFQVESRAQMTMLPRLQPRTYYDLVIEIAIVRPGPIQGDMVHPYLRRREGVEQFEYPNDAIKKVLDRTLGVPIFQEQVIQLAMVAANFSGGEADQLRRAMATWGRNGDLYRFREKLLEGMLANGYSEDYALRLFEQMKGFGSYGFPESHSASFAILAYFSAWFKCHHGAAFYCALLNSQPMGFYTPSQLVQDAQRHRIDVLTIDIDVSEWESTIEVIFKNDTISLKEMTSVESYKNKFKQPYKLALRLGFHLIKGFNTSAAERLVIARQDKSFANLQDLVQRAQLNKVEREALVRADVMPRLAKNRHQAQWQVLGIEPTKPLLSDYENAEEHYLNDGVEFSAPSSISDTLLDYKSTGLTLKQHPMALIRTNKHLYRCKKAAELLQLRQGQFVQVSGVVTCRQRPSTASGVLFLTLEDETGNMNIIIWKNQVERFRKAIMGSRLLKIKGTIERERKVVHVIAGYIEDISELLPAFRRVSRDFH